MTVKLTKTMLSKLKLITEGGEAKIYEYEKDFVLKIFKPSVNLLQKEKKVERFMKMNFPKEVVKPEEIVTIHSQFAGYKMRKIEQAEVIHQLIKPKYLKMQHLHNKDVLAIVYQISKVLKELHQKGIVIGDISDYNILLVGTKVHFIDVDSWGITNEFLPDAYTEIFTSPKAYQRDGKVVGDIKADQYSFAVLAFNLLTRMHPFSGTYPQAPDMTIPERMKKKISVLGKHNIIIPKMIPSWKWMSPDLEETFFQTFEKGVCIELDTILEDLQNNLHYCRSHKLYYNARFNACPICKKDAKFVTLPNVIQRKDPKNGPKVTLLKQLKENEWFLEENMYLTEKNEIVFVKTGRKVKYAPNEKVAFSEDGEFVIIGDNNQIHIYNKENQEIATLEKAYQSEFLVKGHMLYFVDQGGYFTKVEIGEKGNRMERKAEGYLPIFAVGEKEEFFVVSRYPKKMVINANGRYFEVAYTGKIKEYAIKQDKESHSWLFIYQKSDVKFRTLVLDRLGIIYDQDMLSYMATPLSAIDFFHHTIYAPEAGKIVAINVLKNIKKEFVCPVITETSSLLYEKGAFQILNENAMYRFGS